MSEMPRDARNIFAIENIKLHMRPESNGQKP